MGIDVRTLPFPIDVVKVEPLDGFRLALDFEVGRERERMSGVFDMTPYLDKGVFKRIADPCEFAKVYSDGTTACWPGDLDMAPERLYTDCVRV